jgi:hypothetical protein
MSRIQEALDPDLFSGPGSRRTDPETSHQAADRHPALRRTDRRDALIAHADHPAGLTDYELADLIGRQQNSAGKRRGELRDLGLIEQTDKRRPAPSGSPAIVWRITQSGLDARADFRK